MPESLVYLLYGTDRYLVKQETEKIISGHGIDSVDTENYDLDEDPLEDAVESAMTIPFLSEEKAVVIAHADFLASQPQPGPARQNSRILLDYLRNPNPTTILIIQVSTDKPDPKQPIVNLVREKYAERDCRQDRDEDIFGAIKKKLGENGFSIAPDALQLFVGRVGSDRQMQDNELDKLMSYAFGQEDITIDMVKDVTYKNPEDHIYQLVNAIIASDRQLMLRIYRELLESNIDPMWMLASIVSKFQEILYTKELVKTGCKFDEIMRYFSASKGRTYYIMKNANAISDDLLREYLARLCDLDQNIKTGKVDKEVGLELFIQKLYE